MNAEVVVVLVLTVSAILLVGMAAAKSRGRAAAQGGEPARETVQAQESGARESGQPTKIR